MALRNDQYDIIMREYNRRQSENRRRLEEHRNLAYATVERLPRIDEEVAALCAGRARMMLSGKREDLNELRAQIRRLSEERIRLLTESGFPSDYLEMTYTCPKCQDTGYIGPDKCTCFQQAVLDLLYKQAQVREILEKENFEHFSFEFYSDTITDESTGLSAYQTAQKAYKIAWDFIYGFDTKHPNLFLYGNTGVGKTFLSHCIAKELLNSLHVVLYFSAFDLFDLLARSAFGREDTSAAQDTPVFDCDLLIIDDLGTEMNNSFVSSQLFLLVNERLLHHKSTIISTNLTLADFSSMYSERTLSRVASGYTMAKLIGRDIRLQKLFQGGN